MESTQLAPRNGAAIQTTTPVPDEVLRQVMLEGDLSTLSTEQLIVYYRAYCERVGMDPLTIPFNVMKQEDRKTGKIKVTLYPNKVCTAQLTQMYSPHVTIVGKEFVQDMYVVTCRVTKQDGSAVDDIGVVSAIYSEGRRLTGVALENAMMKATTKAKRRAILSAYGIGGSDETEVDGIWNAQPVPEAMDAIKAGVTAEEDDAVRMWREQIEACSDAEGLTEIAGQLKGASQGVKDSARVFMAQACERLNLVWSNGQYTSKVQA